ncbi:MAG: FAD-dependent oxidoreductase, partial [Desulfobacterales bacterium]|nr:FAD-dependent oxidoreductase [Desulfobacterales bacterium]
WTVEYTPTILFDPEHYNVRWLGAPLGEEGRTFVEALIMMGYHVTNLSEASSKILDKIDSSRQLKVFVSPTCPYCPQQAVNALKATIAKPDLISLEIIDIQANPELADKYNAQSVPQVFANEVLIAMGAQSEELFMSSLNKMEQQTIFIPDNDAPEIVTDLVIVGGGPAGLTAGIYASRSGLKAVIVERDMLGGQVATTPVVENYPGLTQVGGKALSDIMVNHALQYVNIFTGEEVLNIHTGDVITVQTTRRKFTTKVVLLATGATYKHLNIPGEASLSGHGVSYCSTCDGPLFKGQKVIIVGGGNSAVTEALHLKNIGVDVTLIHRRDSLRAQNHLVKKLPESDIKVMYNTEVKEIKGDKKVEKVVLYNNKTKKNTTIDVQGVFIAIGYIPSVELASKMGVELTPDRYIKRDFRHRTNIPGVYSAGDVEGGYKQIVTAAGQGSEAALAIFEDLINPYWISKKTV